MSGDLSEVYERRLFNLKLLHGTAAKCIAPTSAQLVKALSDGGCQISAGELSDLYGRKKVITGDLALQLEAALNVPAGWLSRDHNIWLKATAEEHGVAELVASLPVDAKRHLAAFLKGYAGVV